MNCGPFELCPHRRLWRVTTDAAPDLQRLRGAIHGAALGAAHGGAAGAIGVIGKAAGEFVN
ncbi:MAG TPA: hypothetical protein VEK55_04710 [Xanthobacteraceae bacterium]|nr:hypothetical protein [Xanthobacteraceae bacterium]